MVHLRLGVVTFPPVLPRVLAALTGLLFLIGAVGLATVDGDDADTLRTADASTTTTVASDGGQGDGGLGAPVDGGSPSTAAGQPAATAPPGTATTVPSAPATTAKPAPASGDPGQPMSPKLGTYRYRTTADDEQRETSVKLAKDPDQVAGEDRYVISIGDNGKEQTAHTARRRDGIYVRKMSLPSPSGGNIDCDWEPDLLEMKFPLAAGATWRGESTCNTTINGEKATFHIVQTTKVVGAQRGKVGGQEIDVWGLESTSKMTIDTVQQGRSFHFVYDSTGTSQYSPKHGLTVRSDDHSTFSGFGGEQKTRTTRELLSLNPQ